MKLLMIDRFARSSSVWEKDPAAASFKMASIREIARKVEAVFVKA